MTEAINLGDIDDTTALAHVVRTGLLWPKYRDPWMLCSRLEELEELLPDLEEPDAMAAYLSVPARLIPALKEIRNVEVGGELFLAYLYKDISRRDLMSLARTPERYGQDRMLAEFQKGPRTATRLDGLVKAWLSWHPPEPPAGEPFDDFTYAKLDAIGVLKGSLQDDYLELSAEDRHRAAGALRRATELLQRGSPRRTTSGPKS